MANAPQHSHSSTEYTNAPVPVDQRISWWTIALIKIGVVLALPGFLIGAQIGSSMGLRHGAIAFFGGAAILAFIAVMTGTVAARSNLPTSIITQFSFGRAGAGVINLVLAVTLMGWFAVTAELFGATLTEMVSTLVGVRVPAAACTALGGVLMVTTTMFGFKAISRLAKLAVPLLLILLIVVTWLAIRQHNLVDLLSHAGTGSTSVGIGISAVVGGASVGTIIFPDIARFARSVHHGRGAAIFTYGICLPSMFMMVALASIATGQSNIVLLMLNLGLGGITMAFLIFKAWTTNVGNLYSSSLFFSTLAQHAPFRLVVTIVGAAGTLGAMLGLTQFLVPFLLILGITIPPIAGIYVIDFYLRDGILDLTEVANGPAVGIRAFAAWGTAVGVAALTSTAYLKLTGIPACDSIIVAGVTYLALSWRQRRVNPTRRRHNV